MQLQSELGCLILKLSVQSCAWVCCLEIGCAVLRLTHASEIVPIPSLCVTPPTKAHHADHLTQDHPWGDHWSGSATVAV